MFFSCSKLKTIYVDEKWNTNNEMSFMGMFMNCTELVGGNGTTYSSSHIDGVYARIDTKSTPGYFTLKN